VFAGCSFSSSQHDTAYLGAVQYVMNAFFFQNKHLDLVYFATRWSVLCFAVSALEPIPCMRPRDSLAQLRFWQSICSPFLIKFFVTLCSVFCSY